MDEIYYKISWNNMIVFFSQFIQKNFDDIKQIVNIFIPTSVNKKWK